MLNAAVTWNKSFSIGRNRAKTKHGLDLTKAVCSDCGFRLDSLKHMCLDFHIDCTYDAITQIRESTFHNHKNALQEVLRNSVLPHWTTNVLKRLSNRAWNPSVPQVERFWTGTITTAQLETIFGGHIHQPLTTQGLRNLKTAVISLLQPLFDAAKLMIQDRSR